MNILRSRITLSSAISAFLWILAFFFILLPFIVLAQSPLVPCGTVNVPGQPNFCTVCDLFVLLQRIVNYIIIVVGSIAALFLAYGGLLLLLPSVGAGGSGMYQRGKKVLTNTVIGIAIIFLSWVIIDTIMKAFLALNYTSDAGTGELSWAPWSQIYCTAPRPTIPTPKQYNRCNPQNRICEQATTSNPNQQDECDVIGGTCTPPGEPPITSCDAQQLAAQYKQSYPMGINIEIVNIVTCIQGKLIPDFPYGEISYFQKTGNQNCNFTRGDTSNQCTPSCIHAPGSCHYGGLNGKGALAVDFGLRPGGGDCGTPEANALIAAAQSCGVPANKVRCESNDHVHISAPSCDQL